jgi:spore maturation protein CgeB
MDQKKLSPSSVLYNKFTGRSVWGEELVKVYNASKIVINIHSPQPVPIMRDYEVTGCGAFLLTDYANGMENIFELGKELVCFGNATELKDNAIYYLSNQDKIQEIAKRGQQRAYRDHTYAIRMRELLKFIQDSSI